MDYKQLNELLGDLPSFRWKNRTMKVMEQLEKSIGGEGEQGEEGISYEVYPNPYEVGTFIKLTIATDSYGENEYIKGLQFVKPEIKSITDYKPIN